MCRAHCQGLAGSTCRRMQSYRPCLLTVRDSSWLSVLCRCQERGGRLATLGWVFAAGLPSPSPTPALPHPRESHGADPSPSCPRAGTACSRLPDTPPTQDLGPPRDSGQLSRLSFLPTPKVLPPSFHICSAATLGWKPQAAAQEAGVAKRTERHHAPLHTGKTFHKRTLFSLSDFARGTSRSSVNITVTFGKTFQPLKGKPRGLKSTSLKHSPSEYNKEGHRSPNQAYPRPQWTNC